MADTTRLQVLVPKEQLKEWKVAAIRHDMTLSDYVRTAVEAYRKTNGQTPEKRKDGKKPKG